MEIFIQFNFSQINFRLRFSLTVLFLIESSIENICVWTKLDCLLVEQGKQALKGCDIMDDLILGIMTS